MGQIIARITCHEGIIKQDINPDYETYGSIGERDYVADQNLEYESNYDSMYDDMGDKGEQVTSAQQGTKGYATRNMDHDGGQTKKRHEVHLYVKSKVFFFSIYISFYSSNHPRKLVLINRKKGRR